MVSVHRRETRTGSRETINVVYRLPRICLSVVRGR